MPIVKPVSAMPTVGATPLTLRENSTATPGLDTAIQSLKKFDRSVDEITAVIQDREKKDDEANVKSAINDYRRQINNRTYLDEDAYYSRQGKNAYDSYGDMDTELNDIRKDISSGLKDGRQRALFDSASNDYYNRELDTMSRHASKGRMQWLDGEDIASEGQAIQDGAFRWMDNSAERKQINKLNSIRANRNGWGEEQTNLALENNLTKLHVNAIDNILAGYDASVADTYFDTHKEEISESVRTSVGEKIKSQGDAQWVLGKADEIIVGSSSYTEAIEKVRASTDDPNKRAALQKQVSFEFNQLKSANQEAAATAYNEADLSINTEGGISPTAWALNNSDQWESMSPGQRKALQSNTARQFNADAYSKLTDMVSSKDKQTNEDKSKALDYLRKNPQLFTAADYKYFEKELKKDDNYEIEGWASRINRLKVKTEGLNLSDNQNGRLQNAMEIEYRKFQDRYKRKPDANEEDQIMTELVKLHYDKWWNPNEIHGFDISLDLDDAITQFPGRHGGRDPTASEIEEMRKILTDEAEQ